MIAGASEATGLVGAIASAAAPWAKIFSHSKVVSSGTLFLHLAPLVAGGGVAFAADLATLRAARSNAAERTRQVAVLAATHRVVLLGLTLSFISGVLLFLSDVETFLGSIFLWIKLGFVAALLINGFVLSRVEKSLAGNPDDTALWGRLRTVAMVSAFLWIATTLAGVVLKEFA